MTDQEEREMHELAVRLERLTRDTGWEASRYASISRTMERLAEYCAVCDCQSQSRRVQS